MVEKAEKQVLIPTELLVQLTQELLKATIVVCPIGMAMIPLEKRNHLLKNLLTVTKENGLTPSWDMIKEIEGNERDNDQQDSR